MSKRNLRSNQKLDQFLLKPTKAECNQQQPKQVQKPVKTKNPSKRKLQGNLNNFVLKQPQIIKTYALNQLLAKISIDQMLQKSQNLLKFAQQLKAKVNTKLNINTIFHKFFKHNKWTLWSTKYQPTDISQLFDKFIAQQVRQWIKIFYQARSSVTRDSQDSFTDSIQVDSKEEQFRRIMKDKLWNGKALIISGRQGTGKLTMLRCLAETMNMKIYECSNQVNRFQYLKQKYQSTKSQCVKINKSPVPQSTPTIKQYFTSKAELDHEQDSTDCPRSKKIHVIHQFSQIYPEQKQHIFNNQLKRCMQQSKIPFILTTSDRNIPSSFNECDRIQFRESNLEEISNLIYIILHIEMLIGKELWSECIERQKMWQIFSKKLQDIEFKQMIEIQKISEIVKLLDYKFDKIFTFFQFQIQNGNLQKKKHKIIQNFIANTNKQHKQISIPNLPYSQYQQQTTFKYQNYHPKNTQSLSQYASYLRQITTTDLLRPKSIQNKLHNTFLIDRMCDDADFNLNRYDEEINLKHYFDVQFNFITVGSFQQKRIKNNLITKFKRQLLNNDLVYCTLKANEINMIQTFQERKLRKSKITRGMDVLAKILHPDQIKYLTLFSKFQS